MPQPGGENNGKCMPGARDRLQTIHGSSGILLRRIAPRPNWGYQPRSGRENRSEFPDRPQGISQCGARPGKVARSSSVRQEDTLRRLVRQRTQVHRPVHNLSEPPSRVSWILLGLGGEGVKAQPLYHITKGAAHAVSGSSVYFAISSAYCVRGSCFLSPPSFRDTFTQST